jgi:iron uptake system component EfeO
MRARSALLALAAPVVLAALAAGCGGSDSGGSASGSGNRVNVKITEAGCDPAELEVKAGPTTFAVVNDGAGAVSEYEVLDGDRILGEVENLAPGLSGEFSLTLNPGEYVSYCPGGTTTERGKIRVTGTATVATGGGESQQTAVENYRRYVENETASLVRATTAFVAALKAGDLEKAKQLYGPARIPYERIEPVAESFGNLDPAIDARSGDVPKAEWTGFHPIEQLLWVKGTTDGTQELANGLLGNVKSLDRRVQTVKLEPAQVANGAVELLGEVSKSKITGEEERYSHIDLVDFQANVDGARAAFESVRPILESSDKELATEIAARFDDVDKALDPYRRGATGFVTYDQLTFADTRDLSRAIDALAEPLSRVGAIVVAAQ